MVATVPATAGTSTSWISAVFDNFHNTLQLCLPCSMLVRDVKWI